MAKFAKKWLVLIAVLSLLAVLVTGCGEKDADTTSSDDVETSDSADIDTTDAADTVDDAADASAEVDESTND